VTGFPRVVVTGIGAVTRAGSSLDELWALLTSTEEAPVPEGPVAVDPSPWMRPRDVRRASLATRYAVAAAGLAWDQAGLGAAAPDPWRTGVAVGNVYGAPDLGDSARAALAADGPSAVSVHLAAQACENAPAAAVAMALGAHGPLSAPGTACAAGGHAIGDAVDLIRLGRCDVVVAGAGQGPLDDALAASYHAMRIVSASGVVRPFDTRRDGSRFSQGGGMVVLESLDHARARGATVLAELAGHANTNDADNRMAGSPEPMARCLTGAVADAGLAPSDVAAVLAHGTATLVNDRLESEVIADAIGTAAPVTSIKRVLGHGVAAAGAWNAVAAVLAIGRGQLPSAGVPVEVDPDVAARGLDVVSGSARTWEPGPVLSNAFGLGGVNSSLVIRPFR